MCKNRHSLAHQVHLGAHLSLCPLEAPLAQEGPVALGAQAVLLVLDPPVWKIKVILDLMRWRKSQMNRMVMKVCSN